MSGAESVCANLPGLEGGILPLLPFSQEKETVERALLFYDITAQYPRHIGMDSRVIQNQ